MSLTLTKTAITKLKPYFELFQKLGSLRFEPKACLLRALFSARAFEPEPRLILPTAESQNYKSRLKKKIVEVSTATFYPDQAAAKPVNPTDPPPDQQKSISELVTTSKVFASARQLFCFEAISAFRVSL